MKMLRAFIKHPQVVNLTGSESFRDGRVILLFGTLWGFTLGRPRGGRWRLGQPKPPPEKSEKYIMEMRNNAIRR